MKKYLFTFLLYLLPVCLFAADDHSVAYNAGYAIGKWLGYILFGGLLLWGIWRLAKPKKK